MTDSDRHPDAAHPTIHAGFIPLTDCAPLVVAKELGFDRDNDFSLVLHREASWANIRDKVEGDLLDCAIMLAPMPLAATLGLGGRPACKLIAVMSTSLNGNAITLARGLFNDMMMLDPRNAALGGLAAAQALAGVIAARHGAGAEPLTLGMVYPFSCHNYDLRYWLASAGIEPEHDVNLVVVPPPLISASLKSGRIDGFCVGEPWNSVAVEEGHGVIVATKSELLAASPEKVLGLKQSFADANASLTAALIRAVSQACAWLDVPGNRVAAASLLAGDDFIATSQANVGRALTDTIERGWPFAAPLPPDTIVFNRRQANEPQTSHAIWILSQMIRWGHVRRRFDIRDISDQVFRADLYRAAMVEQLKNQIPSAAESGNSNAFYGAERFDPEQPLSYLRQLKVRDASVDLSMFTADSA